MRGLGLNFEGSRVHCIRKLCFWVPRQQLKNTGACGVPFFETDGFGVKTDSKLSVIATLIRIQMIQMNAHTEITIKAKKTRT